MDVKCPAINCIMRRTKQSISSEIGRGNDCWDFCDWFIGERLLRLNIGK